MSDAMNDNPIDRLLQQVAHAPELADSLLDLLPAEDSERALSTELHLFALPADQLASVTRQFERRLRPWRAALQFLQDRGLLVLHAAGEALDRVTVLPATQAVRWLANAIADAEDELAVAHFGDDDDLLVRVVVGAGNGPATLVPLASKPRPSETTLRLELRVPKLLETAHGGLRESWAVVRLGSDQDNLATTTAPVQYLAGAEPAYVIECPWPHGTRRTEVPPNLIREVRLFPMPAE